MAKILNLSDGDYHALDAVSNTTLSYLKRGPWFAKFFRKEGTDAMKLGTLIHAAILEPRTFNSRFIVMPEFTGKTKDGRDSARSKEAIQAKADWLANQSPDAVILTPDDALLIEAIRASLKEHKSFMELVMGCMSEVTGVWEREGIVCKAKADLLNPKEGILIDVKSTKDASLEEFRRTLWNRGYDRQLAWYADGFSKALGRDIKEVYLLAIEKDLLPNERVRVELYRIPESVIKGGRARSDALFAEYAYWHNKGEWPLSISDGKVVDLTYPSFVREEFLGDEDVQ